MNRLEIERKLNEDRTWLLDHLAHPALIERNFAAMIRKHIAGEANPVGMRVDDNGVARSRAVTLQLLSDLSNAQLEEVLPGAPWADGTVGGVLAANADHGRMHWKWVKDARLYSD